VSEIHLWKKKRERKRRNTKEKALEKTKQRASERKEIIILVYRDE
jgi:hypothetical protein